MWHKVTEADTETLIAIANGDRKAFARLFHVFHQELGEFVYRITKSKAISEEIVQDAFMKIWLHRNELPEIRSFRSYLFTITRNHTFNTLRDEMKKSFLSEALPADLFLADDAAETYSKKEELFGILEKAVAQLPPQQQKVWRMNKEEGLPYQQIAEKLKLSPETVKRHISLAMASVLRYVKVHGSWLIFLLIFRGGSGTG